MKLKTTCLLLFCAVFLWVGASCVRADAEAEKGFGGIIVHTLVEPGFPEHITMESVIH